jgi:hypothetical protein
VDLPEEINLCQVDQLVAEAANCSFEYEDAEARGSFQRVWLSARLPRPLPLTSWQIPGALRRRFGSAMISNTDSTLFIYSKTHQNAHRNNTRVSITRRAKVLRDNP